MLDTICSYLLGVSEPDLMDKGFSILIFVMVFHSFISLICSLKEGARV